MSSNEKKMKEGGKESQSDAAINAFKYNFKVLASIVFAFIREYKQPALDGVEGTFRTETCNYSVT